MSSIQETHAGGVIAINISPGGRYGIVPRVLLEDQNLGLDTRCVAAWLSSQSEGFQVSVAALCRLVGVGKGRWQRMAREMEKRGYLARAKHPSGKHGRWVWEITFCAIPNLTIAGLTADGPAGDGGTVGGQASDIRVQPKEDNSKKTSTHTDQPRVCASNPNLQTINPKSRAGLQGALDADQQALVEANFQAAVEGGCIKNPAAYRHRLEQLARAGELQPPPVAVKRRVNKLDDLVADLMKKGGAG